MSDQYVVVASKTRKALSGKIEGIENAQITAARIAKNTQITCDLVKVKPYARRTAIVTKAEPVQPAQETKPEIKITGPFVAYMGDTLVCQGAYAVVTKGAQKYGEKYGFKGLRIVHA